MGCCCSAALPPSIRDGSRGQILLSEERVSGSLRLKNFRSPNKYSARSVGAVRACVALTTEYFFVLDGCSGGGECLINVPWTDGRLREMKFSVKPTNKTKSSVLVIDWDASLFQPTWSGSMSLRLQTEQAHQFLETIQAQIAKTQDDRAQQY